MNAIIVYEMIRFSLGRFEEGGMIILSLSTIII